MTPERWQRVQDLFHQALDQGPETRGAFLREACDDADLRAQVEALLGADADRTSVLDVPVGQAHFVPPHARPAAAVDSADGRAIGPYRLVREIGRGGMGTVYLARRTDLDNDVAIKLVRGGVAAPETVERFLQERRLLARLEHPDIGRLLDAGMADDDTPYFVMEYVEGVPITDHCARKRLGVDARLALFQRVCRAVHFAHQNLVVHRDLKPANILVTDDGQVKLLDFGIAKLVDDDGEDGLTRTGLRLMTPEYAAPEQVRAEPATTATDVYALGVLLYELLTGVRPYALEGRTLGEIERIVCEEEPTKPSTVVRRRTASRASEDGDGAVPPSDAPPSRQVGGDLDVICLKALAKEPENRYASAEALAEDVGRHRAGQPVLARPSTVGYRARKFVRRNRLAVALTAAFVAAAAALAGGFTWRLAEERDRAQTEAEKATQVSDFLLGLFEASDPNEARGDTLTADELLERGVEQADALAGEPAVQAEMLDVIGRTYGNLGRYEQAGALLKRALALRREHLGPAHPDVAASLHHLGVLRYLDSDVVAEPLLRDALAIRRRALGDEDPLVAETLNLLARVLNFDGRSDEAEAACREGLAIRRRLYGRGHPSVAESLHDLSAILQRQGDLAAAERPLREALAIRREALGGDHPLVATTLNLLAGLAYGMEDYDESIEMMREVLAIRRTVYGDRHPVVAASLQNLGLLMMETGDVVAADSLFREAIEVQRDVLGDQNPEVAISLGNLGLLLVDRGDYAAAEPLHREALSIRRRAFGDRHPDVAISLDELASVEEGQGDLAAAESLLRQALSIRREAHDGDHPLLARVLHHLGGVLRKRGDLAAAGPLLREAVAMRREVFGDDHERVASSLEELARVLHDGADYAGAEPLYREALAVYERELGETDPTTRAVAERLAALYADWGRPEQAERWRQRARRTR